MKEVKNCKVQCDEPGCGWSEPCDFEKLEVWHNKPCPQCGRGVIVNDTDLRVVDYMKSMVYLTRALDVDGSLPKADVRFDSSVLRRKSAEAKD